MKHVKPPIDFGILLNLAFQAFKTGLNDALAAAGFDDLGPSFGYVFRLLDAEPLSLSECAARLAITPQGASKILTDMVARGYVERCSDERDARITLLSLTARARRAMVCARRFHARFERDLARRHGGAAAVECRKILEDIAETTGADRLALARPT